MEAPNNVDETAKDLAEFLRSVTNRIRIAKRGFSVGHLIKPGVWHLGVRLDGDRYIFLWVALLDPNSEANSPQYLEGTTWPRNTLIGDLEPQIEAIEDQCILLNGETVEVSLKSISRTLHPGRYTFTVSLTNVSSTSSRFEVIVNPASKSGNKLSRLKDTILSHSTMSPASGPSGSMVTTQSEPYTLSGQAPDSTADQQHSTVGSSQASGEKPQYDYYQ